MADMIFTFLDYHDIMAKSYWSYYLSNAMELRHCLCAKNLMIAVKVCV